MSSAPLPAAAPTAPTAPQPYRWAMLAGTWLVYYCFGLTASALAPLVVPIETELGLSHSAMGSVFGAWTLTFIFTAMPCGALMDRIGPRKSLVLSALFIAASGFLPGSDPGAATGVHQRLYPGLDSIRPARDRSDHLRRDVR